MTELYQHVILRQWKFPLFLEPKGPLPCSQEPVIGTYDDPDESSPHLHIKITFNGISPSTYGAAKEPLPFRFCGKILHVLLTSALCSVYLALSSSTISIDRFSRKTKL